MTLFSQWLSPNTTPQPSPTVEDLTDQLAAAFQKLARRYTDYETTDPLTMGGVSGTYILQNPYGTPCDWSLVCTMAFDVATGLISTQSNLPLPANNTTYGVINQPNPGVAALPIQSAANVTLPGPNNWFPMGNDENLVIALAVANSKAAYVTVQFRRLRDAAGVSRY